MAIKIDIVVNDGYELNPDDSKLNNVINEIGNNNGVCLESSKEEIRKCPCKTYLEQGLCIGGLYCVKRNNNL